VPEFLQYNSYNSHSRFMVRHGHSINATIPFSGGNIYHSVITLRDKRE